MSDYLTDADYEEDIRCRALGLESPFEQLTYERLVGLWDNRDKTSLPKPGASSGAKPPGSESDAVEGNR